MPDLLLIVLVDVVTAGITSLVVTELVWHHLENRKRNR